MHDAWEIQREVVEKVIIIRQSILDDSVAISTGIDSDTDSDTDTDVSVETESTNIAVESASIAPQKKDARARE